jgi:DHA2 family multidrug resistance protein
MATASVKDRPVLPESAGAGAAPRARRGITQPAAPPRKAAINPWIIAVAVMLATFMEVLDTTVVNVSLPHIAGNLSATVDESTWVLTSYLVANAVILPMTGWLANQFGRKFLLMGAVAGFTLSSFMCGLAPNLPFLIVFRIIQGATGGGLQPLSQAIMLEAFPIKRRGLAMGFWGLGVVVAPMLGPVLGGWITDNYSWRWIFYINLPVGMLALLMTELFIVDPPYIGRKTGVDYWGIAFLALGIAGLQIMLDKGQELDWFSSDLIRILAAAGLTGLTAFLVRESLAKAPIVDLGVFRDRTYATGVSLMTVLGFVLYASTVLIPIFLQTLLGYPAVAAGMAMLPRGLGSFLAMPLVGFLLSKIEPRRLLFCGFLGGAFAMWRLGHIDLEAGYWNIFWPQLIQGLSLGFLFVPLTTISYAQIPKERMGNATSMFNLMRNLGGSIGISFVTTLIARRTQANISVLGASVTPLSQAARQAVETMRDLLMSRGADATTALQQAYAAVFNQVQSQAGMLSFITAFELLGALFLAVIPLILLMRKPPRGAAPAAPH